MKHQSILFYSRCLLAILAVTGTALEIIKYGIGMLMYYTVQSNLLVSLFAVYMVYAMFKGNDLQGPQFLRIKAAVTMSIMITCVVYHFMLAPLAEDLPQGIVIRHAEVSLPPLQGGFGIGFGQFPQSFVSMETLLRGRFRC